jgi:hypothetical protein
MRVWTCVPGPDDDGRLRQAAERMWTDFTTAVRNPLGDVKVIYDTAQEPDAIAWCRPFYGASNGLGLGDRAHIIASTRLLTAASDVERRLTLLHECLHMSFAFGEHRERWRRIDAQREERHRAAEAVSWTDADRANHMATQDAHGFNLLRIPDEIVAEQRLKRDYPEWFPVRADYYVEMRRGRAAEIQAGRPDVLWPFSVFYELLRISFFAPLLDTASALQQELQRLEADTAAALHRCASIDLHDFLMNLKPHLLDVSHERPLTEAEAAYDRLFERVTSTEPARE